MKTTFRFLLAICTIVAFLFTSCQPTDYSADINALKASRDSLAAALKITNANLQTTNNTMASLSTSITTIQAQLVVISGQITTLNTTLTATNSTVAAHTATIATIQSQIKTIQDQIAILNTQQTSTSSALNTLSADVTSIKAQLTSILSQVATLNTQQIVTSTALSDIYAKLALSNNQLNSLSLQLNALLQLLTSNGLIAYYPFSGNASDESGNGNSGTVTSAVLTTDRKGIANSAYYFNGSNSLITVPHNASLNALPLTVNLWFKTNQNTGGGGYAFVTKYYNTSGNGWTVSFITPSGLFKGQYLNNNNLGSVFAYSKSPVNDNYWHMVTVIYSLTGENVYIDNKLVASEIWIGTIGASTSTRNMLIGKVDDPGTNTYYNGSLDDIRIYNRALTSAEVAVLYNE